MSRRGSSFSSGLFLPWLLINRPRIPSGFNGAEQWVSGSAGWRDRGPLGGCLLRAFLGTFQGRPDRVTFRHVAGQDAAKQEVTELGGFPCARPERFPEGRRPRSRTGFLLMGAPPGTGKTLLARGRWRARRTCPFFSTSGSEFVEVFVGVGRGARAQDVRGRPCRGAVGDLHRRGSIPIGRASRAPGLAAAMNEREQTLKPDPRRDGRVRRGRRPSSFFFFFWAATNRPRRAGPRPPCGPGASDRQCPRSPCPTGPRGARSLDIHARALPMAEHVGPRRHRVPGRPAFSRART